MRIFAKQLLIPIVLGVTLSAHEVRAQSGEVLPNSAKGSQVSATRAGESQRVIDACASAAEELAATRRLVKALERENSLLADRLATELKNTQFHAEIAESRRLESNALRQAIAAKDQVIGSRSEVIGAQERLIAELKGRRRSPWQRVGDVLIGVAAGALIR